VQFIHGERNHAPARWQQLASSNPMPVFIGITQYAHRMLALNHAAKLPLIQLRELAGIRRGLERVAHSAQQQA